MSVDFESVRIAIESIRRVGACDYVLPDDHNGIVDALSKLKSLFETLTSCKLPDLPRKVKWDDVILPEDHNTVIDVLKAMRDCMAKDGVDVSDVDDKLSKLRYVKKGDVYRPEDHNAKIDAMLSVEKTFEDNVGFNVYVVDAYSNDPIYDAIVTVYTSEGWERKKTNFNGKAQFLDLPKGEDVFVVAECRDHIGYAYYARVRDFTRTTVKAIPISECQGALPKFPYEGVDLFKGMCAVGWSSAGEIFLERSESRGGCFAYGEFCGSDCYTNWCGVEAGAVCDGYYPMSAPFADLFNAKPLNSLELIFLCGVGKYSNGYIEFYLDMMDWDWNYDFSVDITYKAGSDSWNLDLYADTETWYVEYTINVDKSKVPVDDSTDYVKLYELRVRLDSSKNVVIKLNNVTIFERYVPFAMPLDRAYVDYVSAYVSSSGSTPLAFFHVKDVIVNGVSVVYPCPRTYTSPSSAGRVIT